MRDDRIAVSGRPNFPEDWHAVILPVDKPTELSSFGVIRVLRRLIGVRKMGHAGTLDPMATGLLIILIGRATKQMSRFLEMEKGYSGTIRLGEETASFDAETEVSMRREAGHVDSVMLESARQRFLGTITQSTPIYSAVKVGGERLYRKARRGERVATPDRIVDIHEFTLGERRANDLDFEVRCSKGTYIRSLAHEFGRALGVGGHLLALRRTAIGDVSVEEAWTLDAIRERMAPGAMEAM